MGYSTVDPLQCKCLRLIYLTKYENRLTSSRRWRICWF